MSLSGLRFMVVFFSFILFPLSSLAENFEVKKTITAELVPQNRFIYSGEIELPADGRWEISGKTELEGSEQFYLLWDREKNSSVQYGVRFTKASDKREVNKGKYKLQRFFRPLLEYGHVYGYGPDSLQDLATAKSRSILKRNQNVWGEKSPEGDYAFLIPHVTFSFDPDSKKVVKAEDRQPLMVELQPYVDDGKHWVLYTDSSLERVDIDPRMLDSHKLTITPVLRHKSGESTDQARHLQRFYRFITVQPTPFAGVKRVVVEDQTSDRLITLTWDFSGAQHDPEVLVELKKGRLVRWGRYLRRIIPDNPAFQSWLNYGKDQTGGRSLRRPSSRDGNRISAFSLLGGRAAIRETLQMQELVEAGDGATFAPVPVNGLKGVEVAPHPFEEMLAGKPGGKLALADLVPLDHFFVYAKPEAVLWFLDSGSTFLGNIGKMVTANELNYNLQEKYFNRLGVDRVWLSILMKLGAISEMAISVPDLFFIDGTDISVIVRLAHPKFLGPILRKIGLLELNEENVYEQPLADNRSVFWYLDDELLICSTSESEIHSILELQKKRGSGSLGRSSEFRYMLTKLPLQKNTTLYTYFSDPFIRHLVSPATKIGQLRRLKARRDMEMLIGGSLLAKAVDSPDPITVESLVGEQYVPSSLGKKDYRLTNDHQVQSKQYGRPGDLTPLSALEVDQVTPGEAKAYERYLQNYNRYWRQFFDPIAMRLDDFGDDGMSLSTFILPLLESSIYTSLREVVGGGEDGHSLRIPSVSPPPALMMSLNVREETWVELTGKYAEATQRMAGLNLAVYDDLGPGIHLAVHDADPVIGVGATDMLGALNGQFVSANSGGWQTMGIPIALSFLTRPCTLFIETANPERTRLFLQQAVTPAGYADFRRRNGLGSVEIYQVDGQDKWICSYNILDMVKLRYGIEVEKNYLIIKNIPWTEGGRVVAADDAPLNGAQLQLFPPMNIKQLPALHNSAKEVSRKAANKGMAQLYPLLASGCGTVEECTILHGRLFGFTPVHPDKGNWIWDGFHLGSSLFGSIHAQKQSEFETGKSEGEVLEHIDFMGVNMQFEAGGLRTVIHWKPANKDE